jgi:steroid delta-isomerase-like uncharacterized protein
MSEDNKAVARRLIEEAWNGDSLDTIDELVAEDHVDHDPAQVGSPGGRAGMRAFVEQYKSAFPDSHIAIEEMISEGDLVVIRWRATGTHQGELMGVHASGKPVEITGIGIDRIVDGQIVESWTNWDTLGMLGQIGAIPAAAGASA